MSRISSTLKHCRTDNSGVPAKPRETGFTWTTAPGALAFSKQQASNRGFSNGKEEIREVACWSVGMFT